MLLSLTLHHFDFRQSRRHQTHTLSIRTTIGCIWRCIPGNRVVLAGLNLCECHFNRIFMLMLVGIVTTRCFNDMYENHSLCMCLPLNFSSPTTLAANEIVNAYPCSNTHCDEIRSTLTGVTMIWDSNNKGQI